jgi:hypothetical protein
MRSVARLYADVNKAMEESYYDYENYEFDVGYAQFDSGTSSSTK